VHEDGQGHLYLVVEIDVERASVSAGISPELYKSAMNNPVTYEDAKELTSVVSASVVPTSQTVFER
jgi:hypothetical protein